MSILVLFVLLMVCLSAEASIIFSQPSGKNAENVDVFESSTKVEVRHSDMANWMENQTKKAMKGEVTPSSKKKSEKTVKKMGAYQKSYKWF